MGEKFSLEEDKALIEGVLGIEAFQYLVWSAWQVCSLKSGNLALIWGDGHCGETKGDIFDSGDKKFVGHNKNRVLDKLHAWFGGIRKNTFAADIDLVSDMDMFYRASMYYSFRSDKPSVPSQSFNSSRSIKVSDVNSTLEHYQTRSYLAYLARLKTVVFVPLKSGAVEIGSSVSIPENQDL